MSKALGRPLALGPLEAEPYSALGPHEALHLGNRAETHQSEARAAWPMV